MACRFAVVEELLSWHGSATESVVSGGTIFVRPLPEQPTSCEAGEAVFEALANVTHVTQQM